MNNVSRIKFVRTGLAGAEGIMYVYGYSNLPIACSLLSEQGTGSSPCITFETSSVDCTRKFNIREKITGVSQLVNVPSGFIV